MVARRAQAGDEDEIADVYVAALSGMTYIPEYTDEQNRSFIRDVMLPNNEVWVAEEDGAIVGFVGLGDGRVRHLWIEPEHQNHGIGTTLLNVAKQRSPEGLDLWVFQRNVGARRFYERHGFALVEMTDGERNEEHEPDARYVWGGTSP
jgi:ribosomal protein S18 acetylase RimI-like enzyme